MIPDLAPLHGRVAVVGSGIAGLVTALALAPQPVVIVTRAEPGCASSSAWAQGGIAASLGPDDSPECHLADTLAAGDGLCDAEIAAGILRQAPGAIALLERHGVGFDRNGDGSLALGLEAAHTRRRILHVAGDGSGAAIVNALVEAVRNCPTITMLAGVELRRLLTTGGAVSGLVLCDGDETAMLSASRVVLATGGLGGLYEATTNPGGNYGQGIALAARAGAQLADMEFVQFHPTALDTDRRPMPLVSEAVRGEGAILVNEAGERFLAAVPGADLAPRDIVARAVSAEIARGGRVFLDARAAPGPGFAAHFPAIDRICREAGIDPARQLIPVHPAAHYHMGGIWTDGRARSSLKGLWAVGECAATGLNGANRLASNSLLEAVVMGMRAAQDIAEAPQMRPVSGETAMHPSVPRGGSAAVRPIVSRNLGVLRDDASLRQAIEELLPLAEGQGVQADPAIVALSIATFAFLREESRGAHARIDHPDTLPGNTRRIMALTEILAAARAATSPALARSA